MSVSLRVNQTGQCGHEQLIKEFFRPIVDLTTGSHWITRWLIAAERITSKVLFCFVTEQKRMKEKDGNLKKYDKMLTLHDTR